MRNKLRSKTKQLSKIQDSLILRKTVFPIEQAKLDLSNGRNTRYLPYKGQFSPDFVKLLLNHYAKKGDLVLDPFMGSGTVLFEASKQGLSAYGNEINPAAIDMAKTIVFANLSQKKRQEIIEKAVRVATKLSNRPAPELYEQIDKVINKYKKDKYLYNIFSNAYLRLLDKKLFSRDDYLNFIKKHISIIESIPVSKNQYRVFNNDARKIPIKPGEVDLIITSPPYINVFNYHQHNRAFIDRIYGNALTVARSEFGANRKHRQNRFYTVVQYALDMYHTFLEQKRLLNPMGRMIVIIGRSSKVRGANFRNDYIVAGVGDLAGFKLVDHHERKFKNQYGQIIFEEILHLQPTKKHRSEDSVYELAEEILQHSLDENHLTTEAKLDLVETIKNKYNIKASALYGE